MENYVLTESGHWNVFNETSVKVLIKYILCGIFILTSRQTKNWTIFQGRIAVEAYFAQRENVARLVPGNTF